MRKDFFKDVDSGYHGESNNHDRPTQLMIPELLMSYQDIISALLYSCSFSGSIVSVLPINDYFLLKSFLLSPARFFELHQMFGCKSASVSISYCMKPL